MAWDNSTRSAPRRRTASSTLANAVSVGILAVSHRRARLPAGWLGSRTVSDPAPDPDELARQAAQVIGERTGVDQHDVAVVLGSGWRPAVAAFGSPTVVL